MDRFSWIIWVLILLLIFAACAPLILMHRAAVFGIWPLTKVSPLEINAALFQNTYFQGLVQGLVEVIPVLIAFGLANIIWDAKTRSESVQRARHHLRSYFSYIRLLGEQEEQLKGSLTQREPSRRQILAIMRQTRNEAIYQAAALDILRDTEEGRQISVYWQQIAYAIDVLTASELIHNSLGDESSIKAEFDELRAASVLATELLTRR